MKRIYVLLSALLILGTRVDTYGQTSQTTTGSCNFDGSQMESSFDSESVAVAVSEMEPGDGVYFSVDISNSSSITTSWYMANDVLSSLEDAQAVADNGGYTYRLEYTDSDGAVTTLYDSDSVGGEKESTVGEGLNEATDSLDEFFYIDDLDAGESGSVLLYVGLDGESQGNIYQDTLAKLKMNFAVGESTSTTTQKSSSKKIYTSKKIYLVKTGDAWMLGSIICLVLGIVLVTVSLVKRRKGEHLA